MKKNILLIQPDEINYSLLKNNLLQIGYQNDSITRCASLFESIAIPQEKVSIIFADFSLSQRNGLSAIRELVRYFINVPIIMLSDNDDSDEYLDAVKEGVQDVLINGRYDSTQLGKAINVAIERSKLQLESENTVNDYKRHFENGPLPMWIIDESTLRFFVVNNAAVQKYGYSKEEFRKMTVLDVLPEEDIESMLENYYQRGTDYFDAGYWRHVKKSKEVFYVHVYSHSTMFEGTPARVVFCVDVNSKMITDKRNKELNTLIKEQKEQLDSILFSISDAIWSRRADTLALTYANNAYYKLFGYEYGMEPNKDSVIDAVYPGDKKIFLSAVDEVKTTGETEFVYRFYHMDGSLKTLKVSARLKIGVNGQPDMINGITIDITKEKELYDAIRNNEQKLSATINNTKDFIWSVNADLQIIFCNKAFQDFFYKLAGVSLDEGDYVLGNWHSEAFINTRRRDYERAFNGESFSTIVEEHFNGATLYFEISSNPIIDIDEKIIGVNCISRDITKQRMQLLKIQEQNEKLREIAWIQSHKVRGPVASILGLISLVDFGAIENKNNLEIIENLLIATKDLDKVIREVVAKTNEME